MLALHFLDQARAANGRPGIIFAEEALAALQRHSFPGNVRELKNLIERLVILTPDEAVGQAEVELALGMGSSPRASGLYQPNVPFRVLVEEAERTILQEAIAAHDGQMAATARALGLERSHLYKKAKALGLRGKGDE